MADRDSANTTNDTNKANRTPTGSTGTGSTSTGTGASNASGSSAGGKGRGGGFASEFEALKGDLAQVRRDLASIADLGRETVASRAGSARERASDMAGQAKGMADGAKGMADDVKDQARDVAGRVRSVSSSAIETEREMMDGMRLQIGDHPLTSVAVASSLGFLFGWIVSRR